MKENVIPRVRRFWLKNKPSKIFFSAFGTHDQFGLHIEGAAPSGPAPGSATVDFNTCSFY